MHTCAFFSPAWGTSLLQPTHKQRCSNPSMPAHQQFKFPSASLRRSHFSHEPHRSEVKDWLPLTSQSFLVQQLGMVVKWHTAWVSPSIIARGQGRVIKSTILPLCYITWSLRRWEESVRSEERFGLEGLFHFAGEKGKKNTGKKWKELVQKEKQNYNRKNKIWEGF